MVRFPNILNIGRGATPSPAIAAPTSSTSLLQGRTVDAQSTEAQPRNSAGVIACKIAIVATAVIAAAALVLIGLAINLAVAKFCPPALALSIPVTLAVAAFIGDRGRKCIQHLFAKLDGKQPEPQTRVVDLVEGTPGPSTNSWLCTAFLGRPLGKQEETIRPTLDESVKKAVRARASAPDLTEKLSAPKQKPLLNDLASGLLTIIQKTPVEPINRPEKQAEARALIQSFTDKGLTEQSLYRIHGKVWELAGKPDEYEFGKNHAFDLLGRLRNAVIAVASEIN